MNHANFIIINQDADKITLQDGGPWDVHPTITNDAEWVVEQMARHLQGRRLFYFDSEGDKGELLVDGGKFSGFGLGEP